MYLSRLVYTGEPLAQIPTGTLQWNPKPVPQLTSSQSESFGRSFPFHPMEALRTLVSPQQKRAIRHSFRSILSSIDNFRSADNICCSLASFFSRMYLNFSQRCLADSHCYMLQATNREVRLLFYLLHSHNANAARSQCRGTMSR